MQTTDCDFADNVTLQIDTKREAWLKLLLYLKACDITYGTG